MDIKEAIDIASDMMIRHQLNAKEWDNIYPKKPMSIIKASKEREKVEALTLLIKVAKVFSQEGKE